MLDTEGAVDGAIATWDARYLKVEKLVVLEELRDELQPCVATPKI
jgi:hypothetical protein